MTATEETLVKEIRAALEREPRVRAHHNSIHIELYNGSVILEGSVDSVAAKKIALELTGAAAARKVEDRLRVVPAEPRADGAVRVALAEALLQEPTLKNFGIRIWHKGRMETIRETPPDPGGTIEAQISDGAVTFTGQALSLSHKRLAGVLAWWTPGCSNVINRLDVVPPEQDSDAELNDAVRLVLEKDHLLPPGQIATTTRNGVVTLKGLVYREAERNRAELDAWCVLGVKNVANELEIQK